MIKFKHHTEFITITNYNWLPILLNDYHKDIIIEALQKRIAAKQVTVYAFVIMPNHLHIIWQLHDAIDKACFQRDFLKFTARSILAFMRMHDDPLLEKLKTKSADRMYQVWERNSLSIQLYSEDVLLQKMNYIHENPIRSKWKLSMLPEDYIYSSASFYEKGIDLFGIVKHYQQ